MIERNRARTRGDLVMAAIELLLQGAEPTMRAVAVEAGVGERTVYRYFESRDALLAAVAGELAPRIGVPLCDNVDGLERYVTELFAVFEANRELTIATVTSPWAQPSLAGSRSRHLGALTALLRDGYPKAARADVESAAAALRVVVSGSGWVHLRHSCGLPAEQVTDHALWLLRTVINRLEP